MSGRALRRYWPWTQVLDAWLRDARLMTRWLHALGAHAGLLAQVASEIPARLPELPPLPPWNRRHAASSCWRRSARVLRDAAARQPLVIVLDDLHWADLPTLQLLLFVAQDLYDARLLLVATYRDAELTPRPSRCVDAGGPRAPAVLPALSLRGLPRPQVAQLVALVAGQAQSPGLVDAVYAETEGNPFFVTEVARLLAAEGELDAGAGGFRQAPGPGERARRDQSPARPALAGLQSGAVRRRVIGRSLRR